MGVKMAVQLRPLVLSAKCHAWRGDGELEHDTVFQVNRRQALERDRHTCRFCGFTQKPSQATPDANFYMQVHHVDDDHNNSDLSNLVTACMHCHAVQHIGLYGSKYGAKLIWLPEMTQADLHVALRVILVARRFLATLPENTPKGRLEPARAVMEAADSTFAMFAARAKGAQDRFRTDNPAVIADVMIQREMPQDAYLRRSATFSGLRLLLPLTHVDRERRVDRFDVIVDSWLAPGGAFCNLKPSVWAGLLKAAA